MRELIDIYIVCFKVGATTFGGGYSMLPILRHEIVENKKWFSEEQMMDYYAISQGLPGLIAVNVAVFIGYNLKKLPGGVSAALGIATPSIAIITVIATCLSSFQDNPTVKHAFAGIGVCVSALILKTVIDLWKKSVADKIGILLFTMVFLCMLLTNISPAIYVVATAAFGIIYKKCVKKDGKSID